MMKPEKSELMERILENYALGHISRKQMDAMIEAVERREPILSGDAKTRKSLQFVVYMRVGNESQLR